MHIYSCWIRYSILVPFRTDPALILEVNIHIHVIFQIQELCKEEFQWTYYDDDELTVKMRMTEDIFDSLILDTIRVLNNIYLRKARDQKFSLEAPNGGTLISDFFFRQEMHHLRILILNLYQIPVWPWPNLYVPVYNERMQTET